MKLLAITICQLLSKSVILAVRIHHKLSTKNVFLVDWVKMSGYLVLKEKAFAKLLWFRKNCNENKHD